MDTNYKNFLSYLDANAIKYENNEGAKLVWFGYNIDIGTIEIVVDFEHERRIGFFSFLNMNVTEGRLADALTLANAFNESLNYGSLIISQTNQVIYKIMVSTLDTVVTDDEWSEFIFRLWSISRDIYPLFGRLIFMNESPQTLFEEFIQMKEKQQAEDRADAMEELGQPSEGLGEPAPGFGPASSAGCSHTCGQTAAANPAEPHIPFDSDFRSWFLQN